MQFVRHFSHVRLTYLIPDPHSMLIRKAGTEMGTPAPIDACLEGFCPCPAVAD